MFCVFSLDVSDCLGDDIEPSFFCHAAIMANAYADASCLTKPTLQTQSLGVAYPQGTVALSPVDLAIAPGSFTVLLGASGAGKSTLLRSLNGLVRPTEGRVLDARGDDTAEARALRRHRRETGMIFQQHQSRRHLHVFASALRRAFQFWGLAVRGF
jgi:ABC-type phosphate/phosphonate transport system ATPase subunit